MWAILQPALLSHARDVHARHANHTKCKGVCNIVNPLSSTARNAQKLPHSHAAYERSCDEVSTVDAFVDMPGGITGKWKTLGSDLHVSWNRIQVVDLDQYSPERKRQAVLRAWYEDREEAYWEEAVEVLKRVDRKRLANLIRGCKGKRRCQLVSYVKDDVDRHASGETAASHVERTSRKDEFGDDSHSDCQGSPSTHSTSVSDVRDEVGHGSHSTSHNAETTYSTATKNGNSDQFKSQDSLSHVDMTTLKSGVGNNDHSTNQETTSTTPSADDASSGSDLASGDTSTTVPDTTSGNSNSGKELENLHLDVPSIVHACFIYSTLSWFLFLLSFCCVPVSY